MIEITPTDQMARMIILLCSIWFLNGALAGLILIIISAKRDERIENESK